MTGPERPGYDSFDDHASDEDVLKQIEDHIEPDNVMPNHDYDLIVGFLKRFNVQGSESTSVQEVEILWNHLNKNPSLIKDFSLMVSDIKTDLTLSQYPIPISISELMEYSQDIGGNDREFSLRLWTVDNETIPNLSKFGFKEERIRRNALGELEGHVKAGEATRFLGWLVGQRFMGSVSHKFEEYLVVNNISRRKISHLGMVCTQEVVEHIDYLEKRARKYRERYSMEVDALPKYEDVILAMNGVYNLCADLLLGKPTQK